MVLGHQGAILLSRDTSVAPPPLQAQVVSGLTLRAKSGWSSSGTR